MRIISVKDNGKQKGARASGRGDVYTGFLKMKEIYKSKVYTERPDYADFNAPEKFQAVISIIAKRLREYPKAICSYSGGSDSDILIDLIERTRDAFDLPPVKYVFFNTGLEM